MASSSDSCFCSVELELESVAVTEFGMPAASNALLIFCTIGTRVSNKFGVMALMYSTIGMMCSYVRDEDDQLTSIGVSALTGAVLSSGPPQSRALTIAGVTASMSAVNFLDSWQRENSARTYARRGRLQRAMG